VILGAHTVTRLRAPLVADDYGNDERDWTAATEQDVSGCSVQAEPSSEFTTDRQTVVIRKHVFAPVDADVLPTDRIRWQGNAYEIDGEPQREEHGTDLDHLLIVLRRGDL
jgi:hypothetical protein